MKLFLAWLGKLLSGSDNVTPAIGRVIALFVVAFFLLVAPSIALGSLLANHIKPPEWPAIFGALGLYVAAVIAPVTALIAGTNFTEPKPPKLPPHQEDAT